MADTPTLELDPRAASDEKLSELRRFAGKLKWFAGLIEQTWTNPAATVEAPDVDGQAELAIPEVIEAWLEAYGPHTEKLHAKWEHPYPIRDFDHYPSSLREWIAHLLAAVKLLLSLSPDNKVEAAKTCACIRTIAKKLETAATNPTKALATQEVKNFERREFVKHVERVERERVEWRAATSTAAAVERKRRREGAGDLRSKIEAEATATIDRCRETSMRGGNDSPGNIPEEHRTRLLTKAEAAKLHNNDVKVANPTDYFRNLIASKLITPPMGRGHKWQFDIREFPQRFRDTLA